MSSPIKKQTTFFTYFFCLVCAKVTKMVYEHDRGRYEVYRCEECNQTHSVAVR